MVRKAAGGVRLVVGSSGVVLMGKERGGRGRGGGGARKCVHDTICMRSSAWRFSVAGSSWLRRARARSRRVLVAT